MDLKRKLSRLVSAGPGSALAGASSSRPGPGSGAFRIPDPEPETHERKARVEKLRGLLGTMIADEKRRLRERPERQPRAPAPLPGERVETSHGSLQRVAHYLEPGHHHGRVPIAHATRVSSQTVAKLALDPGLEAIDPARLLFVDTETTGLSGGSGTLPFLIGLAWFEDESLRIEQLVLPAPGEEVPMLRRLAERVAEASALVTYNGKSFDWPLLRNRFVMNRVPVATPAAHLDLLHCARRVFRRRLGRVRLVNMEEHVLGMRREDDIDGADIPALFWDLVRSGDGSLIAPVIEHNANDLIALAAILVIMVDLYEERRPQDEPADTLGAAQVALRADDGERADRLAAAAAGGGGPNDVTADALWLAAELARRREDHEAGVALLHRALEAAAADELRQSRFHLALAKLYEHRIRDLERALIHAQATDLEEGTAARDHRVARVVRKMEKARAQREI